MRIDRLFALLQLLRDRRVPVPGHILAGDLGISIRTLYRDIATLQGMGAQIEGAPSLGYILRPGFFLPPLMFSQTEIEALMLGARWVNSFGDKPLAEASASLLSKVLDVLPAEARAGAGSVSLRVGPAQEPSEENLTDLRDAIRAERRLRITYSGGSNGPSERIVWPFAIGYFSTGRVLAAWCENKMDFRHFRTDKITSFEKLQGPMSRRRADLLQDWLKIQNGAQPN